MAEGHHHHGGQGSHVHSHHRGPELHAAPADAMDTYQRDYDAAQPDAGREVIEVDLEAREVDWSIAPGTTFQAWTFNGRIPGPTIEGQVGDVVEIRFTNRLPEPTSIHWHGLRVPASMDGTDIVQGPVRPGETFVYRFRLTDAGTCWYHPHANETEQIERGLYGAIVVKDDDEPVLDAERVLVFDDLNLDRKGRLARFGGLIQRACPDARAILRLTRQVHEEVRGNPKAEERVDRILRCDRDGGGTGESTLRHVAGRDDPQPLKTIAAKVQLDLGAKAAFAQGAE